MLGERSPRASHPAVGVSQDGAESKHEMRNDGRVGPAAGLSRPLSPAVPFYLFALLWHSPERVYESPFACRQLLPPFRVLSSILSHGLVFQNTSYGCRDVDDGFFCYGICAWSDAFADGGRHRSSLLTSTDRGPFNGVDEEEVGKEGIDKRLYGVDDRGRLRTTSVWKLRNLPVQDSYGWQLLRRMRRDEHCIRLGD